MLVIIVIAFFILLVLVDYLTSLNINHGVAISLYYKDKIKLTNLLAEFPGYDRVKEISPYLSLNNDILSFNGDLTLTNSVEEQLHQQVVLENSYTKETKSIAVNISSWIDDIYYLKEIHPHSYGIIFRFYFYIKGAVQRRFIRSTRFECLLLTQDNTTFYTKGGYLWSMTKNDKCRICKFPIEDPIHNQMICAGDYAFIRTGFSIYFSQEGLKNWKRIYYGKRSIKESMVFEERTKRLIFSQYTPGMRMERHYILSYSIENDKLDVLSTFYTKEEHEKNGDSPFCRHMHILTKDPFTNDLYLGTGDSNTESGIYRSVDSGNTFSYVGGGDQSWRTLSFIFTKDFVFWNNDSSAPQYLCRIKRNELESLPVSNDRVTRFPLINGACWGVEKYGDLYIMSSNSEGCLYDCNHRVYGIVISDKGIPIIYNLLAEKSTKFSSNQLFIQGVDCRGLVWFHDETGTRKFKLIKK